MTDQPPVCTSTYRVDSKTRLFCEISPESHRPANVFFPDRGNNHEGHYMGLLWYWSDKEAETP